MKAFTTEEVARLLAGGYSFIRTKNNIVLGLAITYDKNPEGPEVIVVGRGPILEKKALLLEEQKCHVPVYVKKAVNCWIYLGKYRAIKYDTTKETIERHRKKRPRKDISGILFLSAQKVLKYSKLYCDTIPIFIDSVKQVGNSAVTRCTFFTIENSDRSSGWSVQSSEFHVDFTLIGLSGIITSPIGNEQLFDTVDKLDHLFSTIENDGNLHIETNEIWLPTRFFLRSECNNTPKRGEVYRVNFDLFIAAYKFSETLEWQDDALAQKDLFDSHLLHHSPKETSSFANWVQRQIEINRDRYHQSPETKLPKKKREEM